MSASAFTVSTAPDGSQLIRAVRPIEASTETVCADLVTWAARTPGAVFLAEPRDGVWNTIDYGSALAAVRTIGAGLLRSSATPDAPLAIVGENDIDYALVMLAALYVGIPFAPLSSGYASATADPARLRDLFAVLAPGLVFAPDPNIAARVQAIAGDVAVISDRSALDGDSAEADAAFARIGAGTIAKIMFTSGSTGTPKGVITTNGMLAANQTQTNMCWPELRDSHPVIVDWLPWSHTMGGNHIFGMVLRNGGTLYIDDGRPVGAAYAASIRNLGEIAPTMFFSVPRGFTMLLEALHADETFTARFFSRLRGLGNAAASLPNPVRNELIRLARAHAPSEVRVTSSWGMTESSPMATTSWGDSEPDTDTIGTPVPGIALKLVPTDGRFEIRLKGPNVTPGYWRNSAATREAFDEEGYLRTGDAATLKDPADASRGIVFAGRLAENFKLTTGTWVNVGALRLALLERGAPLIEDVVITGHDREALGALVFVRATAAADLAQVPGAEHAALARHERVRAFVANALAEHNAAAPASSTRVSRALIVPEPPDRAAGEITDKGSVNQRRALALRAAAVALLYEPEAHPDVVTPQRATVRA